MKLMAFRKCSIITIISIGHPDDSPTVTFGGCIFIIQINILSLSQQQPHSYYWILPPINGGGASRGWMEGLSFLKPPPPQNYMMEQILWIL